MVGMSKPVVFIILFILNIGTIAAENNFFGMKLIQEQIPVERIDSGELYQLLNKEMIIRVLKSYKDIRLLPESTETKSIIDHYKKLRPNFLAEIILPKTTFCMKTIITLPSITNG